MKQMQPYVVKIYAGPHDQYMGVPSDEDEPDELVRTSDLQFAAQFTKFSDARRAANVAAKAHPGCQFKVWPIDAANQRDEEKAKAKDTQ